MKPAHTAPAATGEMPPILAAHLLRTVEDKLLELLRSLAPEDWQRPTLARPWTVKDVAAHLLDGQLRKLALVRDGWRSPQSGFAPGEDLTAFVNRLNREGVAYYARLSPAVLIALMERASEEMCAFHEALDPYAPAAFAVSWAGEDASPNWFDTARELTERWHHQQQIREAVGRPGIMTRELYFPVLDTFMRALPHAYRTQTAKPGTCVQVTVAGECGGTWRLLRGDSAWRLASAAPGEPEPAAAITIPQEIAWRIFTKGISREEAEKAVRVAGDRNLALHLLNAIAIIG
jgi:uncharacterized protein (TIGR03083 family)